MTASTLPMTPDDGWTLDNLPDNLPKHTELIRGVPVMSPQETWHMAIIRMLDRQLYEQVPDQYALLFEMAVRRSNRSGEMETEVPFAMRLRLDAPKL